MNKYMKMIIALSLICVSGTASLHARKVKIGGYEQHIPLSPIGTSVVRALENAYSGDYGQMWHVTYNNEFNNNWLVMTPDPEAWPRIYGTANTMDGRHSALYLSSIKRLLESGTKYIDVVTLAPLDTKYVNTFIRAIDKLSRGQEPITLRFLIGRYKEDSTKKVMAALSQCSPGIKQQGNPECSGLQALPRESKVKILVGRYTHNWKAALYWNHAKFIAVDGKEVMGGGHNFTNLYFDPDPTHDLSLILKGRAAVSSHLFADYLWSELCKSDDAETPLVYEKGAVREIDVKTECGPISSDNKIHEGNPSIVYVPGFDADDFSQGTVISVGVMGKKEAGKNAGDMAIVEMIRNATKSVRISQQDLGPIAPIAKERLNYGWPESILAAIAEKANENVMVEIILSQSGPRQEGKFHNGWSLKDSAKKILKAYKEKYPDDAQPAKALCKNVYLMPFMAWSYQSVERKTAAMGNKVKVSGLTTRKKSALALSATEPNHSKFLMVDDQAFYIGSNNMYVAKLAEYGYIVDDTKQARFVKANYWNKIAEVSDRFRVSGNMEGQDKIAGCVFNGL